MLASLAKATTQKPGLAPGFCFFVQTFTGFVILSGVKDPFLHFADAIGVTHRLQS